MKVGPQTVSALVHLGLLAGVVFLVRTEARIPTSISAFISGESEDKPPPPPPPTAIPKAATTKARGTRTAGPSRPAAAAPAEQSARVGSSAAPLMDLGLLEADDGEAIPEGAVVVAVGGGAAKATGAGPIVPPPPVPSECVEDPTSPEPLTRADVDYPPGMGGVAGRVLAKAFISADGTVTNVEIVGSLDPAIDQAVRDSLLRWRFRPARRCHKAVPSSWTLALSFEQSE